MGERRLTPHIEAGKGDYAKTVLLPGDPQRAEWMAQMFLEAPRCVNRRRGALGFTGLYRGRPVSIQATGIGVSSFLIYTHEALSLLTVVDNLVTGEQADYSERQALFTDMSRLALEIAGEGR